MFYLSARNAEQETIMMINASASHWESLTDSRRPKRVRTRRTIRNERRREMGR